jgi:hypothetical protein
MGLTLIVFDAVLFQPVSKLLDARTVEADMIDPAGPGIGFSLGRRRLITGTQIFVLVVGVVGLAEPETRIRGGRPSGIRDCSPTSRASRRGRR